MKTIARLPVAQLAADHTHVEAFKALAHLSRLQIFFALVKAEREMAVGEIQEIVEIPGPTLSHHLEKLKHEGLLEVRRDGSFLWYSAKTDALEELLTFLYAECCTRNKAVKAEKIIQLCK